MIIIDMTNLNKILTGTALAASLSLNSYSQDIKNTIVAYVSAQDEKDETIFNVDSLKAYGLSFKVKKENLLDLIMAGKPKEDKSDAKTKLYLVRKTEKDTRIIPTITEGGYDFSKDSKKEIEKQIKEFIKEEKMNISNPVKYGSGEMFMEIVGE